jgi:hypothetical protein
MKKTRAILTRNQMTLLIMVLRQRKAKKPEPASCVFRKVSDYINDKAREIKASTSMNPLCLMLLIGRGRISRWRTFPFIQTLPKCGTLSFSKESKHHSRK